MKKRLEFEFKEPNVKGVFQKGTRFEIVKFHSK